MADPRNPQHDQMAHESMARGLRAQAEAIWPQERAFMERYGLQGPVSILDVGCGTGEFARRIGEWLPEATILGVDILEGSVELARRNAADLGERATFRTGDAYALDVPDGAFDLVVNRHMLQSVPEPERIVAELRRVARPGGRVHLLVEDYAMIHFHPVGGESDRFWQEGPITFGRATGTDLRIGRKAFGLLHASRFDDVRVDYVTVDPVRVPRETIARIWEAWRDGYSGAIAAHSALSREEVDEAWRQMLACLTDPAGYGVWQIPVLTATRPPGG